jgi:ABC-type multidrug transport system ATPase subunit
MKPASGTVLIDGVELYAHLKAFRSSIGFVPAEFALQPNLTVTEVLQDAARLRLPRRASRTDLEHRALTLLESVGLAPVKDARTGSLSKIEKRRLSIAVELIGQPGILLLDGSAEPLTHFEEAQITGLLRELSRQGLTIVQANEHAASAALSDKAIILAPGGSLAWFGPAGEAFAYLRSLIPAGAAKDPVEPEQALEILENPGPGDGKEWAKRFEAHPAYQKYVDDPLNDRYPDLLLQAQPVLRLRSISKEKLPPALIPRASGVQKLTLFIRRNFRLLWRDKTALLMLAIPPLVALLDFVLSSRTMMDPTLGDPDRPPVVLGLLVFLDLLVAALLVQNEIIKERAVYQREHRTSSLPVPYILSKLWLVGILAIYQGLVWAIIHLAATWPTGSFQALPGYGITFLLVAFTGGILGLMASALARTAIATTAWVLLFTVPQLFLSGSIIPLMQLNVPSRYISLANPSRYAFESLLTASGYGRVVAADPCWRLPVDKRNSMSDGEKQACTCMGINIFSTCSFPGIHAVFSPVIEQPRPIPPTPSSALSSIPIQPLLRPGETLDQYAAEVSDYTSQLEIYQGNYDVFLSSVRQYGEDLANWQRLRSIVIGNAEGVIARALDRYGQGFNVNQLAHWSILAGLSLCLMILLIGIQQVTGSART